MRSVAAAVTMILALGIAAPVQGEEPAVLVKQLGSPDAARREAARVALVAAGADSLSALRDALASGDVLVAAGAADVIRDAGLRGARPELRAALQAEGTPPLVAHACCRALGRVGDYRDIDLLGAAISRLPGAALAIAEIGEPDGREPLRAALEAGSDAPEVPYALVALGEHGATEALIRALDGERGLTALALLRKATGRDEGTEAADWKVWWRRAELARGLGDLEWERSEKALAEVLAARDESGKAPDELLGDLLAIAADPRAASAARTKAILAIGRLGPRSAVDPLLRLLETDADGNVRLYAAEALGRIGDPVVVVDLARYLIFDEEPFRALSAKGLTIPYFAIDSEVCRALVRLGVTGGLDFMIRQIGADHRVRIYHEAVLTLRRSTGESFDFRPDGSREQRRAAAARWRRWFDDHREEIRLEGARELGDPRLRARIARLVDTLGHFHFLNMSRARMTLTLLGEAAVPELVAGLARRELHVRVHSAEVLGWIRSKASRGALAKAAADPKSEVRTAAVAALADMGPGPEAKLVLAALEDPVLDVRIEAARALARAGGKAPVTALRAALRRSENDSHDFRREAWFALAAQGDRDAVDELSGMLDGGGDPQRLVVAARLALVTGRDPGADPEGIAAWREWWKVNREGYTPSFGPGSDR